MTPKLTVSGAALVLISVLVNFSCKKDEGTANQAPLANVGTDRTIIFPQDTVHLDGSSSADADGTITTYKWEKTTGPQQFTIVNANTPKTAVTGLVDGVYEFQLTVIDNLGKSDKDIVQVTVHGVSPCNEAVVRVVSGPGELKEFGALPLPRLVYMGATATDKMVFAGGYAITNVTSVPSDRVDIYNFTTKAWSTAKLSGYDFQQSITAGNKILFISNSSEIDLYDAAANTWSVLSPNPVEGRFMTSVVVLGTKVIFAGGFSSNGVASKEVNIYDAASNTWSVTQLSEGRGNMVTAAVGNKLVFAGGYKSYNWFDDYGEDPSKRIDIYDGATNTWSIADLPQQALNGSAAVVGNKAVFTLEAAEDVLIFDAVSNNWSTAALSIPRVGARPISIGNKILIAGGHVVNNEASSRVDVYDAVSGSWSVANMSRPGTVNWFAGVGNKLLLSIQTNNLSEHGALFEVYDAGNNSFAPLQLSHRLFAQPVAVDGKLYFGGSLISDLGNNDPNPSCKVWQFEFK